MRKFFSREYGLIKKSLSGVNDLQKLPNVILFFSFEAHSNVLKDHGWVKVEEEGNDPQSFYLRQKENN